MRVAILGCGPAGLMAAHAASLTGHDVHIYSKKRKSEMFGAQYLHQPIPGMTDVPPVDIKYDWRGTYDDYRRKVYGEMDVERITGVKVSPEEFGGRHQAWDIRRTYDNLWSTYGEYVQGVTVDAKWVRECIASGDYDEVMSTIPANIICDPDYIDGIPQAPCTFIGRAAHVIGDAPERGQFVDRGYRADPNSVVCNGEENPAWYRAATVYGYTTVEWPQGHKPPISGVIDIMKPLRTNCKCHPGLIRLGRYGKWQKGVLSHTAFTETMDRLAIGVTG